MIEIPEKVTIDLFYTWPNVGSWDIAQTPLSNKTRSVNWVLSLPSHANSSNEVRPAKHQC